jgi:hypothetical protein
MFNTIALLVLTLFPNAARQPDERIVPKGLWTVQGFVVAVGQDALEFKADEHVVSGGKGLFLKWTKETQLEQADLELVEGKPVLKVKAVTPKDLHPDQPIGVTFYADGKDLTLLRAVATGPKLSGKDLALYVGKLGGKATRQTWLKDRVAYDVDLRGTKVTDDDLAALGIMKGIYTLNLSFTAVTDKGVAHLAGNSDLAGLNLAGTKVTDAAVAALCRIPSLSTLNIAQTALTEKGIAELVQHRTWSNLCQVGLGAKAQFAVHENFLRKDGADFNVLMIGDTHYGLYITRALTPPQGGLPVDRRREATTYYHRDGPVGQVMTALEWVKPAGLLDYPSDAHAPATLLALLAAPALPGTAMPAALVGLWGEPAIGVVRLNVGTEAAYGRPYQHVHFYNSTPEIKTFSLPPQGQPVYFGYVRDALERGCCVRVIDGDERDMLGKKGPKKFYSALFVEITRNDLRDLNTQLFTKEALAEFMDALTETGVVCFHTSHRYHDMVPPLVDAAKSLNLAWKVGKDSGAYNPAEHPSTHFSSEWVVIARKAEYLNHLSDVKSPKQQLTWTVPPSTGQHLWRDGQPHDLKPLERPPLK